MTFFVLLSTLGDGILRVPAALLPPQDSVRYVVIWQQAGDLACPAGLRERKDVRLVPQDGVGLCRSRNLAMQTAVEWLDDPLEEAVFILADDDEHLLPDALPRLREYYVAHPHLDVALLRIRSAEDGAYLKPYPPAPLSYRRRPRTYYPSSVELTFRSRLWHLGLRFDERFGLGSERLCAGEEEAFLHDALLRRLDIRILPIDLCTTAPATTGSRTLEVKVLRSKGAVYGYVYPQWRAFLRAFRESLSLSLRHRRSLFHIFRNIWYGVKYIRS